MKLTVGISPPALGSVQYDEAIENCHRAIEIDPGFRNPYNDLGAYSIEIENLMRRRTFLNLLALGTGGLRLSAIKGQPRPPRRIMTVLGPVPPQEIGRTLMHEHVMVDFVGAKKISPGRYDPNEVFRKVSPHLKKLKSLGCDTLVECTPKYIGRDPELLRRLSKAIGLHIITNTGLWGAKDNMYVPRSAFTESTDQLAARWVQEFEDGIPPAGIRPGFMKIGVESGPLSEIHAKLVTAAARTHHRTGLAIAAHTGDGTAALAELNLLKKEGVHPSAFVWVHAQSESDARIHRRAAELGAWIEFDGIAPDTVDKHVELVMRMKRARYLRRVLISQDAGSYIVGEPGGGNFRGYETLFTEFLPALRKAGASEDDVHMLLVRNPRNALTLRSL
jgi:phosphotriesterase-related protein